MNQDYLPYLDKRGNILYHNHIITPHLVPFTPPQHTGKDLADAINNIAPQILRNSVIQAAQPFNNTLDLDETFPDPATIFIITSPILVNNTSTPQRPIPLPKTYNIPIFQTNDNLTV